MNNGVPILQAENIGKTFDDGTLKVQVLKNINLRVMPGERVAIIGSSGSGKTTLLHLLGGLDKPSSGHVSVLGEHFSSLGEVQRGRIRNRVIGFVYQFHHLLPEFTALENVAMPLLIGGESVAVVRQKAMAMLQQVGLDHRLHHKPSELSGGERQRAAVARALVTHPRVMLADEPTGNLDHKTAERVFDLMLDIQKERDTSIVVVTHDASIAKRMDRIIAIEDGAVKEI